MTDEQMDDLMTLAVNMQREAETDCNRPSAMFAYAVQVAVLEIRETHSKYEELQSQNADLAVQLANAESKCRELAAENSGLKDGVNKAIEDIQCFYDSYGWHVSEDGESETAVVALDDAKGSIEHFALRVKTPATDAFLAEVRAQGVELAVDVVKQCYDNICAGGLQENREYEESIVQPHLDGIDDELKEIIAQLRKGAAL